MKSNGWKNWIPIIGIGYALEEFSRDQTIPLRWILLHAMYHGIIIGAIRPIVQQLL